MAAQPQRRVLIIIYTQWAERTNVSCVVGTFLKVYKSVEIVMKGRVLNMIDKPPECQDDVKHKTDDTTGRVITKYRMNGFDFLDVRGSNDKIYYMTPSENWEVVNTEEERDE